MQYDIAVIGNDESAFEMLYAAAAAKLRVAAILSESCHSAWIMSQSLRRLVSGLMADSTAARRRLMQKSGTPGMLQRLLAKAVAAEVSEQISTLEPLGIDVFIGETRFRNRLEVIVSSGVDFSRTAVNSANYVIATGVRQTAVHRPLGLLPYHRPESLFDGRQLLPDICVVGGGDMGAGLSSLFSLFGVRAELLTREDRASALMELAESTGVRIGHHCFDEAAPLADMKISKTRTLVDCRRSVGFTENLNLSAIGVEPDENGKLWCANHFETWCTGVFGVGDVVGFSPDGRLSPSRQAGRVLNRLNHRIPRPNYLKSRTRLVLT